MKALNVAFVWHMHQLAHERKPPVSAHRAARTRGHPALTAFHGCTASRRAGAHLPEVRIYEMMSPCNALVTALAGGWRPR